MKAMGLQASYTVETAGVMSLVLLTIMILINQAFRLHEETKSIFALHESVERARHEICNIEKQQICGKAGGVGWKIEITAPVFRPEEALRLWSLTKGDE